MILRRIPGLQASRSNTFVLHYFLQFSNGAGNNNGTVPPDASKVQATTRKLDRISVSSFDASSSMSPSSNNSISALPSQPEKSGRMKPFFVQENPFSESELLAQRQKIQTCRDIMATFKAPIRFAAIYGSGALPQKQSRVDDGGKNGDHGSLSEKDDKMTDFVFAVGQSEHWHWLNLQQNRNHYSSLKYLGSKGIVWVQDRMGAGIYYNVMVKVNGTVIKYGVISMDRLCADLSEWDSFYVAGRMQKPIHIIRDDARVRAANQINLINAVRLALFTLPEKFSEYDLFYRIASLSYLGDPRMGLAEDPMKVKNIVDAQIYQFRQMYMHIVDHLPMVTYCRNAYIQQDKSMEAQLDSMHRLPQKFRNHLIDIYRERHLTPTSTMNEKDIYERLICSSDIKSMLDEAIIRNSKTAAWWQSLQGLFTAGFIKSVIYSFRKLAKAWQ